MKRIKQLKDLVGVLPTDTLYGLVGSAFSKKAVEKIYRLKKRNPKKPLIILIGSINDLKKFAVMKNKLLETLWPGPVSVILPCKDEKFEYLHRGTNSLAFRLPKEKKLIGFLKENGPIVAPSANPEGLPPAKTIKEAKDYFGDKADFYIDEGKLDSPPSSLIKIEKGKIKVLRKGQLNPSKLAGHVREV